MNIKEQIKELIMNNFSPKCLDTDCNNFLDPIPEVCAQCTSEQIHSLYEQAGNLPIQAGEDGLVNVDSICCTEDEINEIEEMAKIGISPDNHISYKQNYELLHQRKIVEKTSKAQKLLDEKLAYNMINEDGLLADDAIMELCLYGSTTLPYGTLLTPFEAAKRCVKAQKALDESQAKQKQAEVVNGIMGKVESMLMLENHSYTIYADGMVEEHIPQNCPKCQLEAFKKQTLEELEEKK